MEEEHKSLLRRQFLQTAALSSAIALPGRSAIRRVQTSGYDPVLKGGHVNGPATQIDGVIDVTESCMTPGLMDIHGDQKLPAEMTIRAGAIVDDPCGRSMVDWEKGPPQYFKLHMAKADNFLRHVGRAEK